MGKKYTNNNTIKASGFTFGWREAVAIVMVCAFVFGSIQSAFAAEDGADFLGVRVIGANKVSLRNASVGNGAELTSGGKKELRDEYTFPSGKLPGGIRKVKFFYGGDGSLVLAEALVPMHKMWERNKERNGRYEEVLQTLENKYGTAHQTKYIKNEFGSYPQYSWYFGDKSAVILKSRGPVYGESLQYINLPLYNNYINDKKTVVERNL
jgi:hypothetical protein